MRGVFELDALACVASKRETRAFLDEPVGEATIDRILNSGRLAGSAKNGQPWSFILIRSREGLKELAEHGEFTRPLIDANFAVVIAIPNEYVQDRFDAGRAAQNMMLTAHALGVGSCPVTLHDGEGSKKLLGIPETLEVQIALAFGRPAPIRREGKIKRKPLQELLHLERW